MILIRSIEWRENSILAPTELVNQRLDVFAQASDPLNFRFVASCSSRKLWGPTPGSSHCGHLKLGEFRNCRPRHTEISRVQFHPDALYVEVHRGGDG